MENLKVIELFAGVGGFRVGLNSADPSFFNTIWSNQYEPSTKTQHASRIYVNRFGSDNHVNADIASIPTEDIPDHDMLVGGFPCQDYSVARNLGQSDGIEGKKGVLWWQIYRILKEKGENKPSILFLENVDRILQSPSKQRGRDFAIILQSLADLGYIVEWRVINSADYGMPQRRRRTYILGYLKDSELARSIDDPLPWISSKGVFATAFPIDINKDTINNINLKLRDNMNLADLSSEFNVDNHIKPFNKCGIMINSHVTTCDISPIYIMVIESRLGIS